MNAPGISRTRTHRVATVEGWSEWTTTPDGAVRLVADQIVSAQRMATFGEHFNKAMELVSQAN